MKVVKFGGSSLATIKKVFNIVVSDPNRKINVTASERLKISRATCDYGIINLLKRTAAVPRPLLSNSSLKTLHALNRLWVRPGG